jgi:hypothetical protein
MVKREGVAGAPTLTDAPTGCSNAVCALVVTATTSANKKSYTLTVDVGEEATLTVHSVGFPVDVGSRVVVALAGSSIGDVELSEPRICSADMLGWKGPSNGPGPVQLPKTFAPGDSAPGERPKVVKAEAPVDKLGNADAAEGVDALFISKPKLSKEEKEIAKLEKAAAKGDAKAASKLQILKLKQSIAARRAAGEEVFTDDEMEAAGLTPS